MGKKLMSKGDSLKVLQMLKRGVADSVNGIQVKSAS